MCVPAANFSGRSLCIFQCRADYANGHRYELPRFCCDSRMLIHSTRFSYFFSLTHTHIHSLTHFPRQQYQAQVQRVTGCDQLLVERLEAEFKECLEMRLTAEQWVAWLQRVRTLHVDSLLPFIDTHTPVVFFVYPCLLFSAICR